MHTAQQLAEYLGVSRRTIHRWQVTGVLPRPAIISTNRQPAWSHEQVTDIFRNFTRTRRDGKK